MFSLRLALIGALTLTRVTRVVFVARFIAKMMIPISIIAVMMFAVFALLAWLIPHVLCESSARALSGSSIGIYECIYVSNGDYSHITPSKIFWLMFWSFQVRPLLTRAR